MSREKILPSFLFFVLLSLFLVLAGQFGLTKPIVNLTESITSPIKKVFYRTGQGISQTFSSLMSWNSSAKTIDKLKQEIRDYSVLNAKLLILEEENKALRKQLEAPLPASMKFLPAKTLGMTRYLTIDKGENEGIKIGDTVISENILVGRVVELTPRTAKVLLPLDPESKISSRAINTGARGLVTGEFGTKAVFDKVLQADNLETGDLVVTVGEGGYTKDLLIGKIRKVDKKDVEPYQKAEMDLLLDYSKLETVFIIQ